MNKHALILLMALLSSIGCERSTTHPGEIGGAWTAVYQFQDSYTFRALFFTDENYGWAVGQSGKIAHTTDGGESWELQNSGTTEDLISVNFCDAQTGWVVGRNNTALRTSDGGTDWEPVHIDEDSGRVFWAVQFADQNSGWLLSNNGKLFRTLDGGATWAVGLTWENGGAGMMQFLGNEVGFVKPAIGSNLYRTIDGGSTWSTLPISLNMAWEREIFFVDQLHGWIGNDRMLSSMAEDHASVFRTTDGGESWALVHRCEEVSCSALYFVDKNNGWMGGSEIYYTSDGGVTWVSQTEGTGTYFIDIQFTTGSVGYALDYSGLVFKFQPD